MNFVRSTNPFPAVAGNTSPNRGLSGSVCSVSRIAITRGDIGNSDHRGRCESFSTGRLSSRTGNVPSATRSSPTTTTSCLTIRIPKVWAERGETIIRTISKQHTGGVTEKKDQPELIADGRLVVRVYSVCPLSGRNRQTDQLAAGNCVFFIARGLSRIRSVIHAC